MYETFPLFQLMLATCLQPFFLRTFYRCKGRLYLWYGAIHCISKKIQTTSL